MANAAHKAGIANACRDRLRYGSYTHVTTADALGIRPDTVVVAAEEFLPAARQLITDLGLAQSILRVRGSGAITADDSRADIFVVLGTDWAG